MYKLIKALCLSIVLGVITAAAQTTNPDEYKKNEYYVGYSNQQVDELGRTSFNGVEGSYTRNVHRYFGIRATVSAAFKNRTFRVLSDPNTGTYGFQQDQNRAVYNFLGGIQIKDNATEKRFKPFAFALGGVAVNHTKLKNLRCTSGNCPTPIPVISNRTFTDTGIAGAFGGGLDIKINDRIDFRAIQVDYNPIYSDSRVDNNIRIGIGIVFK